MANCSICNGRKTIECPICRGSGRTQNKTCQNCNGTRKIVCPKCGGTGKA